MSGDDIFLMEILRTDTKNHEEGVFLSVTLVYTNF